MPKPFVLINIPKTGTNYVSEFVRNADLLSIARKFRMDGVLLHHPGLHRFIFKWWWRLQWRLHQRGRGSSGAYMNIKRYHTPHSWLPAFMRQFPAIACLREPLSWHASQYAFMARQSFSEAVHSLLPRITQDLQKRVPARQNMLHAFVKKHLGGENSARAWSKVSLEGYWRFQYDFWQPFMVFGNFGVTAPEKSPLGPMSYWTLMFIHRDPGRLFAMPPEQSKAYFADKHWRQDLCPGWFLRFEKLQEDLRCVMLEHLDYDREVLDAAARLIPARVNVSNSARKERALRELEQKPELREEILRSERIYLEHVLPLAGAFRSD